MKQFLQLSSHYVDHEQRLQWSPLQIKLLQNLLNLPLRLASDIEASTMLVMCLGYAVQDTPTAKSLHFGKLVKTLLSKHQNACTSLKQQLEGIVEKLQSFMKKPAQKHLRAL